jgi:hypothetical protein
MSGNTLLGLETKLRLFLSDLYVLSVKTSTSGAAEEVKATKKPVIQYFAGTRS